MNAHLVRIIVLGLLFLCIFISGFRLDRKRKPYGIFLFTFHKLIALAALVLVAVTVYQMNQLAPLDSMETLAALATAVLFIGTIATGGLASIDRLLPAAVLLLHKLLPYLTVLVSAGTLYLLIR
jgi:hypothetical protein